MEKLSKDKLITIENKLKENPTVATHFGDDLDNRASIYVLEKWAKTKGILKENEHFNVQRIKAGSVIEGIVNIDTGGHKGSKYEDTIIIDGDPINGIKSAIEEIANNLDIEQDIPEQILECADAMPTKTSIFDTKSGMSLQKFTTIENVFKMAKKGLLTKELNDEQLQEYDLMNAHLEQQKIIDTAKAKIAKYTKTLSNGEKIVVSPEFIKAGSLVAYESGINYYASVDKKANGSTFAINAKSGIELPENIKAYGNELVKKYKDKTGSSGVFLHPNGSMLVAGGPKNPDFSVNITQEDLIKKIEDLFKEYGEKDKIIKEVQSNLANIETNVNECAKHEDKIADGKALEKEVDIANERSKKK